MTTVPTRTPDTHRLPAPPPAVDQAQTPVDEVPGRRGRVSAC